MNGLIIAVMAKAEMLSGPVALGARAFPMIGD